MLAEAQKVCTWKTYYQAIRISQTSIISWISQKIEFSRGAMEETLGLNTGQTEWHTKELFKKGIIKRTNKYVHKIGKGQRQLIYKYIL